MRDQTNFLRRCIQDITNLGELKVVLALYEITYDKIKNQVSPVKISVKQFTTLTGLTTTTIQKAVKRAVEDGYVKITEPAEFKVNGSAKYMININSGIPIAHGTTAQESLIDEILGKGSVAEEVPKKKYLTKAAKKRKTPEITPQDLITRFRVKFETKYNCSYGSISKVEISKAQRLLEWYTWVEIKVMLDWFLENYDKDTAFPTDPPNFHIFHGWRDHIHRKAVIGDIKKEHKNDAVMTGRETEFTTDLSDATWDSVKTKIEDSYSETWS